MTRLEVSLERDEAVAMIEAMRAGLVHRPSWPPTDPDEGCPACCAQSKLRAALQALPTPEGE